MSEATTVSSAGDLQQIIQLQRMNLIHHVDEITLKSQGFVTVQHTIEVLQQMHNLAPSIIIKEDNKVVAYALVMLNECRRLVSTLEPMFALFDKLIYNGKPLNEYRFYVMGQICIAKDFRGQGLFEMLYNKHRDIYQSQFDFIITEVSVRNQRSLRAHERVGFETLHTYKDELDEWAVIIWNWKNPHR